MLETLFLTHLLTAIFGVIFATTRARKNVFLVFSISLILIQSLVIGLRNPDIATDTREYVTLFLGTSHFADRIEPLFMLGLRIIRGITSQVNIFLIIFAMIINLIFFSFLYRILANRALLVFAFFGATHTYWLTHIQVMRNGLAAAIFLLGLSFFLQKKMKHAILLSGIATGTHYSMAATIAVSFFSSALRKMEIRRMLIVIVMVGAIIFAAQMTQPVILALAPWFERIEAYSYYAETAFESSTLGLQYLFFFIVVLGFIITWKNHKNVDKEIFWIYCSIVTLSFLLWFNILYRDRVLLSAQMLEPLLLYRFLTTIAGIRIGGVILFALLVPYMYLIIFIWGPNSVLLF